MADSPQPPHPSAPHTHHGNDNNAGISLDDPMVLDHPQQTAGTPHGNDTTSLLFFQTPPPLEETQVEGTVVESPHPPQTDTTGGSTAGVIHNDPMLLDSQERTAGTLTGNDFTDPLLFHTEDPFQESDSVPIGDLFQTGGSFQVSDSFQTGDPFGVQTGGLSQLLFEPDASFFSDDYLAQLYDDSSFFDLTPFTDGMGGSTGLPEFTEAPVGTTLTSTDLGFESLSGENVFDDSHNAPVLNDGTGSDSYGQTGNSSNTVQDAPPALEPQLEGGDEADSDDGGFGYRLLPNLPIIFNDLPGTEDEETDPFALLQAGFESALAASPTRPTDTAGSLTAVGPYSLSGQNDNPIAPGETHTDQEDGGLITQTAQDLSGTTADDADDDGGDAGIWQDYLDELIRIPADGEIQGDHHQAIQMLRSMVADTFFGGPFEQDIAAAHPLLLQHSPAYRTHFTAFQHTHSATAHDTDRPDDSSDPTATGSAPDPALRDYWTTLTTRQPVPPSTVPTPHTLDDRPDPSDESTVTAHDWTTEPIDQAQDTDTD
ncbi:hypothetical protein, partial [Streptomyces sp. NPDC056632]|uniref:hypothetical protein n=1 Tax=Streptomyces sp. NPDC056632 TaxID=3345884 RepID=UPI0036CEAEAE